MNKSYVLFLMVILFSTLAGAGEITRMEGHFPQAAGEEIRLMAREDLLSYKAKEIDARVVDQDGHFYMEIALKETQLVFFRYRHGSRYLYLEPGKSYSLHFEISRPDDPESHYRSLHPRHQGLEMQMVAPDNDEELNQLVLRFDNTIAGYLETHVMNRPRASHRSSFRQLSLLADSLFGAYDKPFFQDYKRYYLAYLETALNARSARAIIEEHILKNPILYRNPMYMDLFNSVFDDYVFTGSRAITRRDLNDAVNRQASYHALMDTLGKDTLLMNDRIRELVMLVSLQEMLGISEYDNGRVRKVLQEAASEGKFAVHRMMASNILYQNTKIKAGFPAPKLVIHDDSGEVLFDLGEEKGKYVYLFFWAGWCPVSMSEVPPMADIASDFEEDISVVGIMVDEDRDVSFAAAGAGEHGMPFRLYHYDGDYRMLDRYRVRSIPQYMLIDPEGKVYDYPFPAPSAGISDRLRRIIRR